MNGLVLEGGAMRGLFTAGILDAFYAAGLKFDGIIGVSAGACFGCNYKSHQAGRVIRYNKLLARDPRYCSWRSLFKTGNLFGADFCYRRVPNEIDPFDCAAYESDPTSFYCVTTDCKTGAPFYRRLDKANEETFDWIRASASMPFVSRPVAVGGSFHLDGGLTDGIPLRYFESLGYDRNIVILTRPAGYRKKPPRSLALFRPFLHRFPAIYNALKERPSRYNDNVDYVALRETAGAAFVIRPPEPLPIGRICHDPDTMQRVYDIGLNAGKQYLPELAAFLKPKEATA